jgi:monoamine oxidase
MIDRRSFLKAGVAATASTVLAPAILARVGAKPHKIIIVGAGLAGLTAGYELKKAGHEVIILEGQSRPGGRVLTLRDFYGGQWADAGAARIPNGHDLTHRYVKEFGLVLKPFYPTEGRFTRLRNGKPQSTDWNGFAQATAPMMDIETVANWTKIKDGNDRLPYAFADRLKDEIRYDSRVRMISIANRSATVGFTEKGTAQTVSGDAVICAVPVSLLKNIIFDRQLPAAKRKIIDNAAYDSASRVFLQTEGRFWRKQGLNGFGFGPNSEEVWDASYGEGGSNGILESYTRFRYSLGLTAASEKTRVDRTVASLARLYPDLKRARIIKAHSKCWTEDPWAKGAWAHLGPLEILALSKPDGRIFFAGEHLSFSPSWMQGAISSGLFVADQISRLPVV